MTPEDSDSNPDVVSELTGQWFDTETNSPTEAVVGSLDAQQRRQVADLQLVHSLLTQLSDQDQDAKEQQVQQLMECIARESSEQTAGQTKVTRFIRPLVRYGIAALIFLGLTVFLKQTSTVTATEAMAQIIAALDLAVDRTYAIRIEGGRQDPGPAREEPFDHRPELQGDGPPERPGQQRREDRPLDFGRDDRRKPHPEPFALESNRNRRPGERAVLDGSTLYLRGRDQFVLFRPTPSGRTLINGGDLQIRWMIRPEKPVMVSSDPEAFPIPMPKELAAILSLDFKATLQHISSHYQVKFLDDSALDEPRDDSCIYLDAAKANPDLAGPQNIELWAEAQTGLLLRIEFADIQIEDYPMPVRVIIELTEQTPLTEDWFTRQTHHDPDAEVIDITGQRSERVE